MTAGLTIRVDRFGQVKVVPVDLIYERHPPRNPDAAGVYRITTCNTNPKEQNP